jgi:hypothetical protein
VSKKVVPGSPAHRERIVRNIERHRREVAQYLTVAASWNDNNPHKAKLEVDPGGVVTAYLAKLDAWLLDVVLSDGRLPELPEYPDAEPRLVK